MSTVHSELFTRAYLEIGRGDWQSAISTMKELGTFWVAGVEDVVSIRRLVELGADVNERDPFGRLPLVAARSRSTTAVLIELGADSIEEAIEAADRIVRPELSEGKLRVLRGSPPLTKDLISASIHSLIEVGPDGSVWTVCFGGVLVRWSISAEGARPSFWIDLAWDQFDWIERQKDSEELVLVAQSGQAIAFDLVKNSLSQSTLPDSVYLKGDEFQPLVVRGESVEVDGKLYAAVQYDVQVSIAEVLRDGGGRILSSLCRWTSTHPYVEPWSRVIGIESRQELVVEHTQFVTGQPEQRESFHTYLSTLRRTDSGLDMTAELLICEDDVDHRPRYPTGRMLIPSPEGLFAAVGNTIVHVKNGDLERIATLDVQILAIARTGHYLVACTLGGGLHTVPLS